MNGPARRPRLYAWPPPPAQFAGELGSRFLVDLKTGLMLPRIAGGAPTYGGMAAVVPAPEYWQGNAGAPAFTAVTLNAAGDKYAWVFRAPKTGNIRFVQFRTGTVTTPQNTDMRLETVDTATGLPTGSLFAANTNIVIASASLAANTWFRQQLTADAAVTAGQAMALCIVPAGAPNFVVNAHLGANAVNLRGDFPYGVDGSSGTYSVQADNSPLCFAIEYDDSTCAFIPLSLPVKTLTATTFNSGSTPDERGNKITIPFGARCVGLWNHIDLDADADFVLYDAASASVLTVSCDKDLRGSASGAPYMATGAPVDLSAGLVYRAVVKPGASNVTVYDMTFNTVALLDQVDGFGQVQFLSTRTDAGAWSDAATTQRHVGGLILTGIAIAGAGGGPLIGGGLVSP